MKFFVISTTDRGVDQEFYQKTDHERPFHVVDKTAGMRRKSGVGLSGFYPDPRSGTTGASLDILLVTNYNAFIFCDSSLVTQCSGVQPIFCQFLRAHDECCR